MGLWSGSVTATASTVDETQLRGLMWGDAIGHSMELYAKRVEALASWAVTAKGL